MLLVSFNVLNYHIEYLYFSIIEDKVIHKINHDQDQYFQLKIQDVRTINVMKSFFYCDCPIMEPCTNL